MTFISLQVLTYGKNHRARENIAVLEYTSIFWCLTPTFLGAQYGPEDGLKRQEKGMANVLGKDLNVSLFSPNDIT